MSEWPLLSRVRTLGTPSEDATGALWQPEQQEEGRGDSGSSLPRGVVLKVEMVKKRELDARVLAKIKVKNFPLNGSTLLGRKSVG